MSQILHFKCACCGQVVTPEHATGLTNVDSELSETGAVSVSLQMVPPEKADIHICDECGDAMKRGILGIEDDPETEIAPA